MAKEQESSIIERFLTTAVTEEENEITQQSSSLRPSLLKEFPGQDLIKKNLEVYIGAALSKNRSLDHVIIHGPPGLGKTTLSHIISNEMRVPFVHSSAPVLDKAGDLAGLLTSLAPNTVLFIDEIHRLNIVVEELLYSAMEDFNIDILVGQGPSARSVKIDLPPFTLVGATTKLSNLSSPLVSRFGIQLRLDYYSDDNLQMILLKNAKLQDISISAKAALALAVRSRGTPRIANRLLRRVRDFADFENKASIEDEFVNKVLNHLKIDSAGLDSMDRCILRVINETYKNGPVGIESIAATVGESRSTIEDVYEPYLVHKELILRTSRGRILSDLGIRHISKQL